MCYHLYFFFLLPLPRTISIVIRLRSLKRTTARAIYTRSKPPRPFHDAHTADSSRIRPRDAPLSLTHMRAYYHTTPHHLVFSLNENFLTLSQNARLAPDVGRPRGQVRQLPDDLRGLPRFQPRAVHRTLAWLFDVHTRDARVRSLVHISFSRQLRRALTSFPQHCGFGSRELTTWVLLLSEVQ
jgi:hypothetical protein